MEHLDFVKKLDNYGISFRNTNVENKIKEVEIPKYFGGSNVIEIKNLKCSYRESEVFSRPTALQAIISQAIDIDSWKHSWHNEIKPENYEKFLEIIQEKIIDRAKEVDFLITVMFILRKEISSGEEKFNYGQVPTNVH
jgi:hypothetical protein